MKKNLFIPFSLMLFALTFALGYFGAGSFILKQHTVKVSAFVRVKNEINTIEACLNSIDGVFDRIVIIHSNEPDDGSIAFMNKWCAKRDYCEIYEYPFTVIPPYELKDHPDAVYENSLAAYYQFGLNKFMIDEYVAKIDADQVYMTQRLKAVIGQVKTTAKLDDKISWGIRGYNTFIYKGRLVKYKPTEMNGGADSFIIKRKYMFYFYQGKYYERLNSSVELKQQIIAEPQWFHFMKRLKTGLVVRSLNEATLEEIEPLSTDEKSEFETFIRPFLKNTSPYEWIKL